MKGIWKRVIYVGDPMLTRGDFGEEVKSGRLDPDGSIWIWDATYGWNNWERLNSDWIVTSEVVPEVPAEAPRW